MTTELPRLRHEPGLDGFRGLAVAGVLAFHGGFAWMGGGFLGVSAFFTLSGFLICLLLLTERDTSGTIRLGAFWARRARRLLPAALVTVCGVALFGATVASGTQLARLRGDGFAVLGYVANWRFLASGQDYAALFAAPSPLLHAWSLAIEEQFYVVFPLLVAGVLAATRGARGRLAAFLGLLAAASVALAVGLDATGARESRIYYGTDTRAAELLAGALLALWWFRRREALDARAQRRIAAAGALATVAMVASWVLVDQETDWLYGGGLAGHGAVAALALLGAVTAGPVRTVLSLRPLQWLGRVSYGLYLYHWPVFLWLDADRTSLDGVSLFALRLAVVVPLAAASYRWLELPIRRGRLVTGRLPRVAIPGGFAVAAAAIVVATVGAPSVGVLGGPRTADAAIPAPSTGGSPRILVTGDSVSLTVATGAAAVESALGVEIVNRGQLGCGVAAGAGAVRLGDGTRVDETEECVRWPARWAADVAAAQPDAVLLVLGAWDLADRRLEGAWRQPCDPVFDRRYASRLDHALDVLAGGGAPVVVATPALLRSDVITDDRAESDRRVRCLERLLRAAADRAGPTVAVVDLGRFVCPAATTCRDTVDGVVLRPDGVHYDGPGGQVVARWLVPRVLAAARAAGGRVTSP